MDIDPQAVTATSANARHNGVADRIEILGADSEIDGKFDVVVANILAGPLVDLAQSVATRLSSGGELALSGILSEQVDGIVSAYAPWIDMQPPAYRESAGQRWALVSGKRKDRQDGPIER